MTDAIELLDRMYAGEMGCRPKDFRSGGITVIPSERVSEIRIAKGIPLVVYSIATPEGAVLTLHPRLREVADQVLAGRSALDEKAYDALEAALTPLLPPSGPPLIRGGNREVYWFRGRRLYCTAQTFCDCSFGDVGDVTNADEISSGLHAKWWGPVYGQIVDGRVVSWAAVKPLSEIAWDLRIETLPEYQGRGYAKSAASAALKHIFENGKIANWGCDVTNTASLRTALALGFQDYGRDFGCVERVG